MSTTLLLVRHGKASDNADDYDWLSATGEQQMECLGAELVRRSPPDRMFHGTQRRHHASAALLRRALIAVDHAFPEPEVLAGLDEFDTHPLRAAIARDPDAPQDRVEAFLGAVDAWAHGRVATAEDFPAFVARCTSAVAHIATAGPGTRLVITSGGVVAAVVAALEPDPQRVFVELLRRTETASVTEVVVDAGALRVVRYGDTSHLPSELRRFV